MRFPKRFNAEKAADAGSCTGVHRRLAYNLQYTVIVRAGCISKLNPVASERNTNGRTSHYFSQLLFSMELAILSASN